MVVTSYPRGLVDELTFWYLPTCWLWFLVLENWLMNIPFDTYQSVGCDYLSKRIGLWTCLFILTGVLVVTFCPRGLVDEHTFWYLPEWWLWLLILEDWLMNIPFDTYQSVGCDFLSLRIGWWTYLLIPTEVLVVTSSPRGLVDEHTFWYLPECWLWLRVLEDWLMNIPFDIYPSDGCDFLS